MNFIKLVVVLAVAASALSLGACAQKKEASMSTSASTHSTYSK